MDLPAPARVLGRSLTAWFDDNRRDLPWRKQRSAYRVWLSEVMLQQTRVSVVEAYFLRFVARFPDVASLAAASEDEVLSLWSGLGYYSRGRNLHRAARAVAGDHGGRFPNTAAGLRALPGVGDYTAAAVASLAFGERVAVVDGNVARVLARLCDDAAPVDTPAARDRLRARAAALVEGADASGPVNEGLMELGALVCTPRSPSCGACPWAGACRARAAGTAASLPKKSPRRARKQLHVASVVVVDDAGRVWLEKRERDGLFGGLLEPPSTELAPAPSARSRVDVAGAWRALLVARGIEPPAHVPAPVVVERTLTHRELRFSVLRVDVGAREGPFVDDVSRVGTSSAVRAVLESVGVAQRAATRPTPSRRGREP